MRNYYYTPPQYFVYCNVFSIIIFFLISSCKYDDASDMVDLEIISLEVRIDNIKFRLSLAQQIYDSLFALSQEQLVDIEQQSELIETMESENQNLKEKLNDVKQKLNNLKIDNKKKAGDIISQKDRIASLEKLGRDQEVTLEILIQKNRELLSMLEGLKTELLEAYDKIKRLEGLNSDLLAEIERCDDVHKKIKITIADLEAKLNDLPDLETTKVKVPEIPDVYSSNDDKQSEDDSPSPGQEQQPENDPPPVEEEQPENDPPPVEEEQPEDNPPPVEEEQPENDPPPPTEEEQPENDPPPPTEEEQPEDSKTQEPTEDSTQTTPADDNEDSTSTETIEPSTILFLDDNGVTVKSRDCSESVIGKTYLLNNVPYLIVDRQLLVSKILAGEDVTKVCTTCVTNMSTFFNLNTSFNQDISSWDVSNVKFMVNLFAGSGFNRDISSWDVSNVVSMYAMFQSSIFNQDIGDWDVSNVVNMNNMFQSSYFNQDISDWDVSSVTSMSYMFHSASFNSDIGDWDVSSVTKMNSMFESSSFNQDIGDWDVSNVTNVTKMFNYASSFDQDLSGWNLCKVTHDTAYDANTSKDWTASEKPQFFNCK